MYLGKMLRPLKCYLLSSNKARQSLTLQIHIIFYHGTISSSFNMVPCPVVVHMITCKVLLFKSISYSSILFLLNVTNWKTLRKPYCHSSVSTFGFVQTFFLLKHFIMASQLGLRQKISRGLLSSLTWARAKSQVRILVLNVVKQKSERGILVL